MQVSFSRDGVGRLVCEIRSDAEMAIVTSSDAAHEGPDLGLALEDAIESGFGESFWSEVGGTYHWMFRREGSRLRVVVLWSTGIVTGWEHKFFSECDAAEFRAMLTKELDNCGLAVPA